MISVRHSRIRLSLAIKDRERVGVVSRSECVWNNRSESSAFHLKSLLFRGWGERGEEMASMLRVVVFTLTLTKLILLGRVWVRHDRHVHRLKLSKYECSETGPIRIAGAPHVP